MINEKNKKMVVIGVVVGIIVFLVWFLLIGPIFQFKKSEKKVLEASKRYFEVYNSKLPTGNRIRTIPLKTLYNKDFIPEDIRVPNSKKLCDIANSWIKVQKKEGEYKYHVYLKCGIFSSKVDHKGPQIELNGAEEMILNKNDKYKELGVKKVTDNEEGMMDTKKVIIDSSKVNTKKNGTYKVTYRIKDSLNNETVKVRTIKVVQMLNQIVKKNTDETNYYKGVLNNNYIKLDGVLFKIVGLNEDGSTKITTAEPLAYVDYNSINDWLQKEFYERLSDSAKDLVKTDSKWCNEEVKNTENYKKCNRYSRKREVGLLSVKDINNSKDTDGNSNLSTGQYYWTENSNGKKQIKYGTTEDKYTKKSKSSLSSVRPTINLKKDTTILSGTGTRENPYILKGNKKVLKAGEKVSKTRIGEYVNYSGYQWRISGTEDGKTKIVLDEIISNDGEWFQLVYGTKYYSTKDSSSIGYNIINQASQYISTKLLANQSVKIYSYKNNVSYNTKVSSKTYKAKLVEVSLFEPFSYQSGNNQWYRESNGNKKAYYSGYDDVRSQDINEKSTIKLSVLLDSNVSIKSGEGNEEEPYQLAK